MTPGDQRPGGAGGDIVYTADGNRLGEVIVVDHDEFVVENGLMFRRFYVLDVEEITQADGGVLTTSLTLDAAKAREAR